MYMLYTKQRIDGHNDDCNDGNNENRRQAICTHHYATSFCLYSQRKCLPRLFNFERSKLAQGHVALFVVPVPQPSSRRRGLDPAVGDPGEDRQAEDQRGGLEEHEAPVAGGALAGDDQLVGRRLRLVLALHGGQQAAERPVHADGFQVMTGVVSELFQLLSFFVQANRREGSSGSRHGACVTTNCSLQTATLD